MKGYLIITYAASIIFLAFVAVVVIALIAYAVRSVFDLRVEEKRNDLERLEYENKELKNDNERLEAKNEVLRRDVEMYQKFIIHSNVESAMERGNETTEQKENVRIEDSGDASSDSDA